MTGISLQDVFNSPFDVYDIVITLYRQFIAKSVTLPKKSISDSSAFPVVNFDPIELFISELQVELPYTSSILFYDNLI